MAFLAAKEDSYLKEPVPAVLRSSGEIAIRYPLWKQAIYGIGSMSYGITLMIVSFYQLPFLLEVAQIRAAWVGNMLLAKKLYDAVIDPVIGTLSDQTDTRFGRRKPWIVLAVIPQVVAWVFMWTSPGSVNTDVEKIIYFLAMMLLFSTLSTCTTVPFQALVPDIAPTYHDRTSVVMFNVLWSLLAAMVGTFAWSYLVTAFPVRPDDPSEAGMTYDYRKGYILAAGVTGCVMFFSLMIGITPVKERQSPAKVLAAAQSALQRIVAPLVLFLRTLFELLTFPPFCIVVALNICAAVSQNFFMNSFVLYMKYQLEFEQYTSRSLLILQISVAIGCVCWAILSRVLGKRWTFMIGMVIGMSGSLALYFVQPGHLWLMYACLLVTGLGAGAGFLIPAALIPDVVEMDENHTGKRREAMFYSCYLLLEKLSVALTGSLTSYTLSWVGYITPLEQRQRGGILVQPDSVLLTLSIMVCIAPFVMRLLSVPLALVFPLFTRKYSIGATPIPNEVTITKAAGSL